MASILPDVRIGDKERDAAARELAEHYTAGRLESGEFESRLELANRAKTQTELDALMRDLPGRPGRDSRHGRPLPRLPLVFVIAAIAVVAVAVTRAGGPPPFFLIPLVWLFVVRPWRRRWPPYA